MPRSRFAALAFVTVFAFGCRSSCANTARGKKEKAVASTTNPAWLFSRDASLHGPLFEADKLIIGSSDSGGIAAYDARSGGQRWIATDVPGATALAGDLVIAYARTGVVAAVDLDGKVKWQAKVPDDRTEKQRNAHGSASFVADALPDHDSVVVAAGDSLFRVRLRDGSEVGRAKPCLEPGAIIARMARLADGGIAVTCREMIPASEIDVRQLGVDLWRHQATLDQVRVAPRSLVVVEGDLKTRWHAEPSGVWFGSRRPASISDGAVVVVGPAIAGAPGAEHATLDAFALAFDAATGRVRWKRQLEAGVGRFDPVACDRGVVVGGDLALLDSKDGQVRWRLGGAVADFVAPTTSGQRLFVAGKKGLLLEVRVSDGKTSAVGPMVLSPVLAPGIISTDLLVADGAAYFGASEAGEPRQLRAVHLRP